MFGERHFSIHQQVIREEVQSPRRGNRRIEHAHRPCRRVSRVHENLPANPLLLSIQRFECFLCHHHFAAHLEIRTQLGFFQRRRVHAQRNRPDRLHVRRHVLTGPAVPAPHPPPHHPILVSHPTPHPTAFLPPNASNSFLPPS